MTWQNPNVTLADAKIEEARAIFENLSNSRHPISDRMEIFKALAFANVSVAALNRDWKPFPNDGLTPESRTARREAVFKMGKVLETEVFNRVRAIQNSSDAPITYTAECWIERTEGKAQSGATAAATLTPN